MSSQLQDRSNTAQELKRRKRGDSKLNKQTTRYQCYCEKIYLSYPALYLHLKNKHPQCFLNNRKIQVTKFKEFLSTEGYKILKMEKENNQTNKFQQNYHLQNSFKPKPIQSYPFPNFHSFPFPTPPNFMMPPLQSKSYFMQSTLPQNIPMSQQHPHFIPPQPQIKNALRQTKPSQEKIQKQSKQNIIKIFNLYVSETANNLQLQKKEIIELQILFSQLIKCVKQKSQKIKSLYNFNGDLLKNQNINFLEILVPYFKEKYLPKLFERIQTQDLQTLTKEQKWIKSMSKNNISFLNIQNSIKEIQKLEKWLLSCQYVKKIQTCEEL